MQADRTMWEAVQQNHHSFHSPLKHKNEPERDAMEPDLPDTSFSGKRQTGMWCLHMCIPY